MEKWEESEQIQRKQNSPGENQIQYNVSNKCTKQKISKIVEQIDLTGNGYEPFKSHFLKSFLKIPGPFIFGYVDRVKVNLDTLLENIINLETRINLETLL